MLKRCRTELIKIPSRQLWGGGPAGGSELCLEEPPGLGPEAGPQLPGLRHSRCGMGSGRHPSDNCPGRLVRLAQDPHFENLGLTLVELSFLWGKLIKIEPTRSF